MKMPKRGVISGVALLASSLIASCGDECSDYSKYSCKEIQEATYNTYFYFPDEREEFLGIATGLSQCGGLAHGYAADHNMSGSDSWSYICCMKTDKSECEEKHR